MQSLHQLRQASLGQAMIDMDSLVCLLAVQGQAQVTDNRVLTSMHAASVSNCGYHCHQQAHSACH